VGAVISAGPRLWFAGLARRQIDFVSTETGVVTMSPSRLMTLPWLPFGDSADTIGAGVEIGGTIVFMVLRHSLMYTPIFTDGQRAFRLPTCPNRGNATARCRLGS